MSVSPAVAATPATVDGRSRAVGIALVSAGAVSVQFGGAVAVTLFGRVGPAGAVTLRLVIAMALLVVGTLIIRVVRRMPSAGPRPRSDWLVAGLFGVSLAAMNLSFYEAIARIPLGPAVSIELMGPLLLAAASSRRVLDGMFVAVAVAGVVTLGLGERAGSGLPITWPGVVFAALAGACWAAYIVLSSKTGARFARTDGLTIAMVVAAVLVTPFGLVQAGSALVTAGALWRGAVIAVLSSGLPYSLDLLALRRINPATFGVLMSLEPAIASVAALIVIHQHLAPVQWLGLVAVVLACAGVTVFGPRTRAAAVLDDEAAVTP